MPLTTKFSSSFIHRYLVFFDDGYAQYVSHENVRLICDVSANVWDDIQDDSKDFIQGYLNNYKMQRPMVLVRKGQKLTTERNGNFF